MGVKNEALITVDLNTGAVTLKPGLSVDAAAQAFWDAVRDMAGIGFMVHKEGCSGRDLPVVCGYCGARTRGRS